MEKSKIVIVSEYEEDTDNEYFILGFEYTIIRIKQTSVNFFQSLFSINRNLNICFFVTQKKSYNEHIQIQYKEMLTQHLKKK